MGVNVLNVGFGLLELYTHTVLVLLLTVRCPAIGELIRYQTLACWQRGSRGSVVALKLLPCA